MSIDEVLPEPVTAADRAVSASVTDPGLGQTQIGTSPVFSHVWPDTEGLNDELRRIVFDKMATTPGLTKSNCGGWQSERDLQLWQGPAIDALKERMLAMVRSVVRATVENPSDELLNGWDIEAWANVNQLGDTVGAHVHSGGVNMYAAIYYVDTGQDSDEVSSGFTRFLDMSGIPRPVTGQAAIPVVERDETRTQPGCADPERPGDYDLQVAPLAGKMVMFPATLPHYVTSYTGSKKRITIAFNLRHTKFVVADFENRYSRRRVLWRNYRAAMVLMYEVKRILRNNLAKFVPVEKWPVGLRRRLLGGGD